MLYEDIYFDHNGLAFCSLPEEDTCFEELVEPELARCLRAEPFKLKHFCLHHHEFKRKRNYKSCEVEQHNGLTLRDLTAKENMRKLWTEKVYLESQAPVWVRVLRRISKHWLTNYVPYVYLCDVHLRPYLIKLIRYQICLKGTRERAESIREFLLRTVWKHSAIT